MRKAALLGILFLFLLGGCAKKSLPPSAITPPSETEVGAPVAKTGAQSPENVTEVPKPPAFASESLKAQEMPLEKRWALYGRSTPPLEAIFFDFDSYEIRDDMKARLQKDAQLLLAHPEWRVELQGNCDERGSSEYNLALGEKRALMVKRYLLNLGIDPKRLSTVSFGEERPLAKGHNEKAWALNRRVDLVIVNK